jgi:hypothetical protein
MALWGKSDSLYSTGTVSVNYATKVITGSGTSFTAAGISTGDVISIGVGKTYGEAVIRTVVSNTQITIASTQFLSGSAISGIGYTISEKPSYTLHDSDLSVLTAPATTRIVGVDTTEVHSADHYAHAGWVGILTYIDQHGRLRRKSEVLVAFSGITTGTPSYTSSGDADGDDQIAPDRRITINTQPSSVGVGTTAVATFVVLASVLPSAALTYQWQYSSNAGIAYTALSNGGAYAGTGTTTLTVTNSSNALNGYYYRAVVTSPDANPQTSNAALMTVS